MAHLRKRSRWSLLHREKKEPWRTNCQLCIFESNECAKDPESPYSHMAHVSMPQFWGNSLNPAAFRRLVYCRLVKTLIRGSFSHSSSTEEAEVSFLSLAKQKKPPFLKWFLAFQKSVGYMQIAFAFFPAAVLTNWRWRHFCTERHTRMNTTRALEYSKRQKCEKTPFENNYLPVIVFRRFSSLAPGHNETEFGREEAAVCLSPPFLPGTKPCCYMQRGNWG